jgi:uncharacterized protein
VVTEPEPNVSVRDSPDESRYELWVDGALAGVLTYRARPGQLALIHTEVDDEFEGRGLASALVQGVLDDLREKGVEVLPFCPYVKGWLTKHPEYVDLVPETRRASFGL